MIQDVDHEPNPAEVCSVIDCYEKSSSSEGGYQPARTKVRQDKGLPGQKLNYATTLAKVFFLMGKLRDTQA